jgi:hypothetical protein
MEGTCFLVVTKKKGTMKTFKDMVDRNRQKLDYTSDSFAPAKSFLSRIEHVQIHRS